MSEPNQRPVYEVMAIKAKEQAMAIIDEKTWNRELVFALQTMRNNTAIWKKVSEENPASITNAIVNIANVGTTLNPALQLAFLIPRKMRINGQDAMSACLDLSYRGLCQIATSAGAVLDMDADCVYEGDYFRYIRGLTPTLEHIPFSMREDIEPDHAQKKNRETFKFVYATAILPFGNTTHTKFIVLDKEEVEKIRLSSQAPDSPMWKNHYGEGARKTAIKKLYKLLPQVERMSTAIDQLNEFDGIDFKAEREARKTSTIMAAFVDAETREVTDVKTSQDSSQGQNNDVPDYQPPPENVEVVTEGQVKLIFAKCKDKSMSADIIKTHFNVASTKDIPKAKINDVLKFIDSYQGQAQETQGVCPECGAPMAGNLCSDQQCPNSN